MGIFTIVVGLQDAAIATVTLTVRVTEGNSAPQFDKNEYKVYYCNDNISHCLAGTVEPVYSGHLGTPKNCPYYRGVLFSQSHLYTFILQWDHN